MALPIIGADERLARFRIDYSPGYASCLTRRRVSEADRQDEQGNYYSYHPVAVVGLVVQTRTQHRLPDCRGRPDRWDWTPSHQTCQVLKT